MLSLKRRIGVLTAVAVLAAMAPTFTATPAGAAPATTAITSAAALDALTLGVADYLTCPDSASIPSAGFTDTTSTDVDCLAYYGITLGTTATTYEPTASVARWAMALYLTRTLSKAGVTLGTGADQGFTDISGKSAEIQTAINQLKQLGVTTGTTATTYSPDDNVIRQEMAMFIERTLDNIAPGPGGTSDAERVSGLATAYINSNCNVAVAAACTGKYNYSDIDSGTITVEASDAVKELYALNIHDGLTATTFSPDADMTRAAMATFLVAALNHSNLRPEGLIIQATSYASIGGETPSLSVTHRDASWDAIAGTAVDVFVFTSSLVEGVVSFGATGLCSAAAVTTGAITGCSIDVSEPVTDLSGNMVPTAKLSAPLLTSSNLAGTDTYHAWTAAVGTAFDNDLHSSGTSYDTIVVTANPAAMDVNCTTDVPTYANSSATGFTTLKYGTVTTISCQVTNKTDSDTYSNVPKPLHVVTMNRTRECDASASCLNGSTVGAETVVGYTDATGAVSFTVTGPADPLVGTGDKHIDTITLTGTNITAGLSPIAGKAGHMIVTSIAILTTSLDYLDTAAASDVGSSTQTSSSSLAATASNTRSVSHTSHDQYGDTVAGEVITFTSVSELPKAATVANGTPGVFTLVAHGLAVGDDVTITTIGGTGGTPTAGTDGTTAIANGQTFVVGTVTSVDVFELETTLGTASTELDITAPSVAATPTILNASSFSSATRTTNASGVATFSWADTEGTSGKDTVTSDGATGAAATAVHYRLTTAADTSSTDADGTIANGDVAMSLVEFDAVGKDFIVEVETNTAATDPTKSYMQFTYDSNDQFAVGGASGTLNGTAATEAVWVTRMGTMCALACATGGVRNDLVYINGWTGLSTAIVRYTSDS